MQRLLFTTLLVLLTNMLLAQCIITLQPGPLKAKDADVFNQPCSSSYAMSTGYCDTTNLGNSTAFEVAAWTYFGTPGAKRSLLEFDLDSLAALGYTVSNATLILTHSGTSAYYHCGSTSTLHPCDDNSFRVKRIVQPWDEHLVTWVNQPLTVNTIPGLDFVTLSDESNPYDTYSINVTDMVNFWLTNPTQNFGMMMQLNAEAYYKRVVFATSDNSDSTRWPKLILELNGVGPAACNNLLEGNVFDDANSNCFKDVGENGLPSWIVKVEPGPFYANTDANGKYSMWLPDNNYDVTQIIPNPYLWDTACPLPYYSYNVTSFSTVDTITEVNFGVKTDVYCPQLTVDIGSSFLRPCHLDAYYVNYCNVGNDTASGVFIELEFDSLLTPVSSSLPWSSVSGNTYTFPIGTLLPNQCGTFNLGIQVSCSVVIGETYCVDATILPLFDCTEPADPDWDQSSVSVEGDCVDSLACFTITNTGDPGDGDMEGTSDFEIYEDGVLVFTGVFQITGGADTTICWPANGHTIQLYANQRPGHPGHSHPNDVIENCGEPPSGTMPSLGFENDLPQDDDQHHEVECQPAIASYDPNDKTVVPEGVGPDHYITADDQLEYRIRFQNTGTDTAFNIYIYDTLSTYLNPATFISGASSHSYTWEMFGAGIVKWTFANVLLPDSTTDEPGSHGFVKFKIKQHSGNLPGTVIENRVGIVFDINVPVITNTAFNTIYEGQQVSVTENSFNNSVSIAAFPNPTSGVLNVELYGFEQQDLAVSIRDLSGRTIRKIYSGQRNIVALDCTGLTAGMYVLQVNDVKHTLATVKIIVR